MDDNKIDNLLAQYSESLGRMPRSVPAANPSKTKFWKPVFATAAGLAVISVVLMPRRAEAASIDKMIQAFDSTHFWSAKNWMRKVGETTWNSRGSQTFLDGDYVQSGPASVPGHLTILTKGGFQYFDYQNMPIVLKEAFRESEWSKNNRDPMKQAKFYARYKKGSLIRKDGVRFNGLDAYTLTVPGTKGKPLFQAIVQKSNDLPMQFTMVIGGKSDTAEIKTEYQYRQPISLKSLEADPKKEIVDIEKERSNLVEKWNGAKPDSNQINILSSTISPNGVIWIAWRIVGDSADKGSRNVELDDPNYVSKIYQNFNGFVEKTPLALAVRDVVIARFAPTYDRAPLPQRVNVRFGEYVSYRDRTRKPNLGTVSCPLTLNKYGFPSFFAAIEFNVNTNLIELEFWSQRANARKLRGDYKGAIEGYMKSYEIEKLLHGYFNPGFNCLKSAAECYDKLGDHASAEKLRNMIPKGSRPHF